MPVTVPGDLILVQRPAEVVWAGGVCVVPQGFELALLRQVNLREHASPPTMGYAIGIHERHLYTWLAVTYADGRSRAADLNDNTPHNQPGGPHLEMISGTTHTSDGWEYSRWWITPLPPPGPVIIAIHLDGQAEPSGSGFLDGHAMASAAARCQIMSR
ncbi:MAG: hypothetical protein ACLQDY_26085 [Streptosporangiaceae bacterium]